MNDHDSLMVVSVLLMLCVGGLIGLSAALVWRLTQDRRVLTEAIQRLADKVLVAPDEQMSRLDQESKERVALHHIDVTMGRPVVRDTPETPAKEKRLVMDAEDD